MKSLKSALLGATFLAGASVLSAANAADVYERGGLKDGPAPYLPAITWTGFYLGGNVGAAFNDDDVDVAGSEDDTVVIGGLHVGFNWQKPSNLVLGIEGDVNFADDIEYVATVRGRLGWAAGPTLFYATGGGAFLSLDDSVASDDDVEVGYVAGLGMEHKLRPNVSIGLEGLYYAFDEDDTVAGSDEVEFFTLRARMSYHFGGYDAPLK